MTSFDDIYDLFLVGIRDYKIDKLYAQDETKFKDYIHGFMVKAIPKFDNCQKDLSNRDDTLETFNITLSDIELDILSDLMVIEWLKKEINNINQLSLHLQTKEFKTYAEAQNLEKKVNHKDGLREEISQRMVSYGLKNVDWTAWSAGNYS